MTALYPERDATTVPAVTRDQMAEVDRIMVGDLRIELVQMMENAGSHLADLASRMLDDRGGEILILAGSGGNGGGGLAAARHLLNRNIQPSVVLGTHSSELSGIPRHQFEILQRMGIEFMEEPRPASLLIDSLIGYGLRGAPTGRFAELIEWANAADARVLALDTPSGLDVTSGEAFAPAIEAEATMTLGLPKVGMLTSPLVGDLYLADISVPRSVYRRMGLDPPEDLFTTSRIVRLVTP